MTDHDLSDEGLRTRLTRDLPRYTAPPALRRSVMQAAAPPPPRPRWVTPLLSAAATALLILLAGVALLPPRTPADPVRRLVRAVVNEHTRAAMWGARHQEVLPAAIPWLTQESGIGLTRVFIGDERLQFVGAEPVYLERERGVALHYRDGDGHLVTYVALPARALTVPVPDRNRVQIDRFRPALLHDSGFAAWLWRQGDIACVIVSDMASVDQLDRFKDYFVRVRVATEPFQAF
jgi:anti-sigma factor RsiW